MPILPDILTHVIADDEGHASPGMTGVVVAQLSLFIPGAVDFRLPVLENYTEFQYK